MGDTKDGAKKTRWGCLILALIPTILIASGFAYDKWKDSQPLAVKLRDVFEESGFKVPEYVTEISGSKGHEDFQGDFTACVSFPVRPDDIDDFITLSSARWDNPGKFIQTKQIEYCGEFEVPIGSLYIEERYPKSEYECKYAVDRNKNRVYYYRASW